MKELELNWNQVLQSYGYQEKQQIRKKILNDLGGGYVLNREGIGI